jgi:hypothetical protein
MKESKEKIKSRMIRNASRMWGYQDTQSESSFDPFVGMILGALAGELEKVSGEIAATESRVVERVVELLTPEPVTGPYSAHAIISAMPTQPQYTIGPLHQFYTYKKRSVPGNHSKAEEESVFFTPTSSHKLFKGKVCYLAAGRKLFEIQEEQYKEVYATAQPSQTLPQSSLWMGLDLDDHIETIDGLSLCFDLKSGLHEDAFYNSLALGKWAINGHPMQTASGFNTGAETIRNEMDALINQEMNVCAKICSHVNNYYQKKFISLTNGSLELEQYMQGEKLPPVFKEKFSQDDLDGLDRNLYWVEVKLPEAFQADVLEEVSCSINCFPVINRRLHEFTQTSRDFPNIIPLQTDDTFLDIKSVSNIEGKQYAQKALSGVKGMEKGAYILRHGGVGRFDTRNAMEILNYLLELLRDESAAFSVLGTDMISSNLRELNQMITRLDQRLKDSNVVKEETSYLALRAKPEDETVFVEFWSTQGVFANGIKAGSKLNIYEGSDIEQDSVALITPSIGGRERLDTRERINTYRKALLSHGRVVTAEDIKALCHEHFGNRLEKVEIKKGLMKGPEANQGFVRTIDIHINLDKRKASYEKDELKFLKDDLLVKLEEQSSNVMPFRCIINNNY